MLDVKDKCLRNLKTLKRVLKVIYHEIKLHGEERDFIRGDRLGEKERINVLWWDLDKSWRIY